MSDRAIILALLLAGCAPSYIPLDESLQFADFDARPTCAMTRLPVAGNPVFFAVDVPESEKPAHIHRIDAWCQAYPLPGVRFYVFTYHHSPLSYRNFGPDALIRLSRYQDYLTGAWIVGDLSWEVPHLYYGADDPPPYGIGPVTLPPDDAVRRAQALALESAP